LETILPQFEPLLTSDLATTTDLCGSSGRRQDGTRIWTP